MSDDIWCPFCDEYKISKEELETLSKGTKQIRWGRIQTVIEELESRRRVYEELHKLDPDRTIMARVQELTNAIELLELMGPESKHFSEDL
jgi:hypothetical protein